MSFLIRKWEEPVVREADIPVCISLYHAIPPTGSRELSLPFETFPFHFATCNVDIGLDLRRHAFSCCHRILMSLTYYFYIPRSSKHQISSTRGVHQRVQQFTKGLVTNYREGGGGGATAGEGQVEFYPYKKKGGGGDKSFSPAEGGRHKQF